MVGISVSDSLAICLDSRFQIGIPPADKRRVIQPLLEFQRFGLRGLVEFLSIPIDKMLARDNIRPACGFTVNGNNPVSATRRSPRLYEGFIVSGVDFLPATISSTRFPIQITPTDGYSRKVPRGGTFGCPKTEGFVPWWDDRWCLGLF
ncbi:MAG: hypothetical protein LBE33_06180 [Zoogloeaceae bacterium]|nr:hypothetical protein [Zoogloeaceae bacterium]